MRRVVEFGVFAAAMVLHSGAGHGATHRGKAAAARSCVLAYRAAVKAEQASHLREAQKTFATCSQPTCGDVVRRECLLRHDQLVGDIPTIVPLATDVTGEPVVDVKVTMDGEVLISRIDGRAEPVDPGVHQFTFSTATASSTQKVVILQGQRNQPIAIALGLPGQPRQNLRPRVALAAAEAVPSTGEPDAVAADEPSPSSARTSSQDVFDHPTAITTRSTLGKVVPYVATGIGLLGVGSYALLTYWGRKDNAMFAQCRPDCPQSSLDHVRKMYLVANISLGMGLAALGTATWLYLRSSASRKQEEAASGSRVALDVVPLPDGALASMRGAF